VFFEKILVGCGERLPEGEFDATDIIFCVEGVRDVVPDLVGSLCGLYAARDVRKVLLSKST
jgi:hypothetical protein